MSLLFNRFSRTNPDERGGEGRDRGEERKIREGKGSEETGQEGKEREAKRKCKRTRMRKKEEERA